MTFTITAGWWLAPFVVTIATFIAAYRATPESKPGQFGDIGGLLMALIFFGGAAIISLTSWLAWALL